MFISCFFFFVIFFFQAEDGIRDLVRSRGLGDVYKRQDLGKLGDRQKVFKLMDDYFKVVIKMKGSIAGINSDAVSYTHLTLPTSDLV